MKNTTMTSGKLKVTVEHDRDAESPMEGDGNWTFYSFNRRHTAFKHPDELDTKDIRQKLRRGLAFVLSCYEHGGIQWWINGEAGHPSCPFDTADVAGMLVWENDPADIGAKTIKDRRADAGRFLAAWNAWANGECYWYSVTDETGDVLDSCCGFIGDPKTSGLIEAIKGAVGDADVVFAGDAANRVSDEWPIPAELGTD